MFTKPIPIQNWNQIQKQRPNYLTYEESLNMLSFLLQTINLIKKFSLCYMN